MQAQTSNFWRSVAAVMVTLLIVVAFKTIPVPRSRQEPLRTFHLVRRTAETRGLSAEAREEQTGGYYQDLLNGASDVTARQPTRAGGDAGAPQGPQGTEQLEELTANVADVNVQTNDFLVYRPRPNLDLRDPRFKNVRHVSNSLGYNDRDYSFERTPGTRRVVFLGDSMARALGVEPGAGFEPRLEAYLNAHDVNDRIKQFELINTGVSGYRITQIVDIAHEDGAKYKPDAYVLVVSWLTIARKWGLHLAQLVNDDIDPKYDALRKIVADAGLKKGDSGRTSEARLAPFVLPVFRWAIAELKQQAAADGAQLGVLLMPHLKGIGSYDRDFDPIRRVLEREGVPYVDLLDTFDDVDIASLDVGDGLHPNERGHQMLFEQLYRRLNEEPAFATVLKGPPVAKTTP